MLFVSDNAKARIVEIMQTQGLGADHFVRVSVTSGGCSGLSYSMEFDNEDRPNDQVFEDNGVKVVTDLRSFLYLCNTWNSPEVSKGKGSISTIQMPPAPAGVGKASQFDPTRQKGPTIRSALFHGIPR